MDQYMNNETMFKSKQEYLDWVIVQHLTVMSNLILERNKAAGVVQEAQFTPVAPEETTNYETKIENNKEMVTMTNYKDIKKENNHINDYVIEPKLYFN